MGLGKGRQIFLTEEDVHLLENRLPGIELISPEDEHSGNTMTYGQKSITQSIIGVYPSFEELRTNYPDWNSRFLNRLDLEKKRRVIFLGTKVKEKIFGDAEAIGKTVLINNIPFVVVGLMRKKIQNSMYNGPDEEKAAIPFSTYKAIFGVKYLDRLIYRPRDISRAEEVKKEVYKVLAAKYKFDPEDTQALRFWDTIEDEKIFQKIFARNPALHGDHRSADFDGRGGRCGQHHVRFGQKTDQRNRHQNGPGRQEAIRPSSICLRSLDDRLQRRRHRYRLIAVAGSGHKDS